MIFFLYSTAKALTDKRYSLLYVWFMMALVGVLSYSFDELIYMIIAMMMLFSAFLVFSSLATLFVYKYYKQYEGDNEKSD